MNSLKFDFSDNPRLEFENMRLIASLKGWSDEQLLIVVVLNLPQSWRTKLMGKTDEKFKKAADKLTFIQSELIERVDVFSTTQDAASLFTECALKPGEMLIDFALRAEKAARGISNEITEDQINSMVIGRILDSLPPQVAVIVRCTDSKDFDFGLNCTILPLPKKEGEICPLYYSRQNISSILVRRTTPESSASNVVNSNHQRVRYAISRQSCMLSISTR